MQAGVNFTNVLWAAFKRRDPKSEIKLLNLTVFFALLGSERVKAAHIMLVKLTPGHNFIVSFRHFSFRNLGRKKRIKMNQRYKVLKIHFRTLWLQARQLTVQATKNVLNIWVKTWSTIHWNMFFKARYFMFNRKYSTKT